jgi:hypothetical protein
MSIVRFIEMLRRILGGESHRANGGNVPRRRHDPEFGGRSSNKDIDQLPPERAAELAGHAPERVDT